MISTHLYGIIRKQIMSLFSFRSFDYIKKMLITIFDHVNSLARDHLKSFLTRRRRGEYCQIIPETKSRGLFDNIHQA